MAWPDLLFWIAMMVLAFIAFLGLQMRYFGGLGLRVFVNDQLKTASRAEAGAVIASAVGGPRAPHLTDARQAALAERLKADYPGALAMIRTGRRITLYLPFLIGLCLIAKRFLPL